MIALSGSIERIVFRNPDSGFCVARFQLVDASQADGGVTTLVGIMPEVRGGELLHVSGVWETHPLHGRNFQVARFEEELPTTVDGIERYLASGAIQGIGPVTASRIVDAFGAETLEVIDTQSELLLQIGGVSRKRLDVIRTSWAEQRRIRELSMFLQEHGMSVALARRIFDVYGDRAAEVIAEDPYRLAHDVYGVGFKTADALARTLGVPTDSVSRYVAGLRYVLSDATEDGHVFLLRGDLLFRATKILDARIPSLEPALLELVRRGDAAMDGETVYLAAFYRAETGVAEMIEALKGAPSPWSLDPRFDAGAVAERAAEAQGLELAEKQRHAVELALREKVSVLTGGPGTGKTSTLRTIITALEAEDITFCLCAPTGRAAKRVAETTSRPASTIHRLLEYQPGINSFNFDRSRPLPYDFIIVDEVSMLDLLLCYHLLKAIPAEAHLLLVGDADQLPSVGPGSVLRDLLASQAVPSVTLTELFRQARDSQIILAAHAINHGALPDAQHGSGRDYFFVETEKDEDVLKAILRLVSERIPLKFGFDPIEDIQVVAPMHNGPVGVVALNVELQKLLNPPRRDRLELSRGIRTYRLGDKVMQIRNNYDKDVFNGDVGRIVALDATEQMLMVAFGTGDLATEVMYSANELDDLVLAYAVSVHKAQGSEFAAVVMPVVTRHYMLLQRHLVYTAVTRARQLCVLVGSSRAMSVAVNADRRERRNTALARRLANPTGVSSLQLELV